MASVRSFKKDIDYLLSLVLEECVEAMENRQDADKEKILAISRQVILNHRELRRQANHIDGKENRAIVKQYMKSLAGKLFSSANDSLEQLYKVLEKK